MHQGVQGLGLWCLTPPSTIFQLYRGGQFFFGGQNRNTWRKPPICRKSLTKLSQNAVSSTPRLCGIRDDRY